MGTPVIALLLALTSGHALAGGFDPTAPPVVARTGTEAAPSLSALAWVRVAKTGSIAWYGGRVVQVGDPVDGGRVAAIREDRIEIQGAGGRRLVPLLNPAASVRQQKKSLRENGT